MMTVTDDIRYIGVNDHKIDLFEGQYKVPDGMAYNSYVILDEKIAVMDSVDKNFGGEWLDNLRKELGGRTPDYLVVQHMEPDHSANIVNFLHAYPDAAVVGNAKTFTMMEQFFDGSLPADMKRIIVKNGDKLELGKHVLTFVFAPMVHWPEVMVTYDSADKVLFSADGFGKFGANDNEGVMDSAAPEVWDDEARRYYIGIVGKYGVQTTNLLKKAAALDIEIIASLHGPVLKDHLGHYLDLYTKWASYTPETQGVLIAYASVYGHTKEAAQKLADLISEKGTEVKLTDLARDDMAEAVADAFRYDRVVFAAPTYNMDVFPCMRTFIENLTERNFQKRKVAFVENGTWAPAAAKVMKGLLENAKNLTFAENTVTVKSALNAESEARLAALAEEMA